MYDNKLSFRNNNRACPGKYNRSFGKTFMTTQQTTWTEYTGSDEQIAELQNAKRGFVLKDNWGMESPSIIYDKNNFYIPESIAAYWIIPADPLRGMKVRQGQTGQPVWVRVKGLASLFEALRDKYKYDGIYSLAVTTAPDWGIPGAEYSFTEFVETGDRN